MCCSMTAIWRSIFEARRRLTPNTAAREAAVPTTGMIITAATDDADADDDDDTFTVVLDVNSFHLSWN